MWFKSLSPSGYLVATVCTSIVFIFLCISITQSWSEVSLEGCTASNGTHIPSTYLYLQPRLGMCSISNAISATDSQCILWTDTTFWNDFDAVTHSGGAAANSAIKTQPAVYAIMCVMIVLVLACFVALLLPLVIKSETFLCLTLTRWRVQFVVVFTSLFVCVFLITDMGGEVSTYITDSR